MNISGILERVFNKIPKEHVANIITLKRPGWEPEKKNYKKNEIREEFLSLTTLIEPDEVEDFVEMAVMTKSIGLPAYTYKVNHLNFLTEAESGISIEGVHNMPFQDKYLISIEDIENGDSMLKLTVRLKEYSDYWRRGERCLDTLSAVYRIKISLDKTAKVLTIFSGNNEVQNVIKDYLGFVLKWPIQSYRIRESINQINQIGSASFKTAVLLDFIFTRLHEKGIFSRFKEIKFNTKNKKHTTDGIRNITINGRNLLSSQLACQYITLGSDILSFKVDMTYNDVDFTTLFSLKGKEEDILKIVVIDSDDDIFKQQVIDIIQSEYIELCSTGLKNVQETSDLLKQIYEKFIHGDKLTNEVIQNSSLKIIKSIAGNLEKWDLDDENNLEMLYSFYEENKIILDSVGYDDSNEDILKIKKYIGYDEEEKEQELSEDEEIAIVE
ncbi:hypothetical protein IGM_05757 [Bacillus cereus HuB4-4]|uniref:Uncharacterized protein n=1 Tax=Bacillus cereus HuB4-4 TaxID=1053211 RepID=A0A9W5VJ41_BACCE|nr:hypothetical protein [Bacillus cereus]EOP81031.1 hypothetical protein IGM_05757 [Bacillus cereus HuB4-4]